MREPKSTRLGAGFCATAVGLAALAAGCGGGSDGPAAKAGTVNPQGAMAVVTQTAGMKAALEANNGAMLSSNVTAVGISGAMQIVSPGVTSAIEAIQSAVSAPGPNGGSVDCTETGCVYDNYTSGTGANVTVIDGSITSSGSAGNATVTSNLTIAIQGVQAITYKLTGSLAFTATSIDGKLQATGTATLDAGGQSIKYSYFNLVEYNLVALTGTTPSGGSIYAKWGVTIDGVPNGAGSQAWEGTVTF